MDRRVPLSSPPPFQDWPKAEDVDPNFTRTAFNTEYDRRRAACLARHDHALLDAFYVSRRQNRSGRSQILEFGCELTGGSFWLANSGRLVVADVMLDTLRVCEEQAPQRRLRDLQLVLLQRRQDFAALAPCDLFYSALSLKRIPPTTLIDILSGLLSKVTTGGVALIHAPTQHRHKALMVDNEDEPDLHLIPQWVLTEIFKNLGFSIELIEETVCFRSSDITYHSVLAERVFPRL